MMQYLVCVVSCSCVIMLYDYEIQKYNQISIYRLVFGLLLRMGDGREVPCTHRNRALEFNIRTMNTHRAQQSAAYVMRYRHLLDLTFVWDHYSTLQA